MTDSKKIVPREDEDGLVLLADSGKKGVFDNPANVKLVIRVFFAACAVMFALDVVFFFHHKHLSFHEPHDFKPEGWFGFYPFYGFVACVLLVLAAKGLRKILMRDENYYAKDDPA